MAEATQQEQLQAFAFEWFAHGWIAVIDEIVDMVKNEGHTYESAIATLKQDVTFTERVNQIKEEETD